MLLDYWRGRALLITLSLCFVPTFLSAQARSHEIGRVWDTFFPTESIPEWRPSENQMTYPAGDYLSQRNKNLQDRGLWIGVTNWTDKQSRFYTKYVSENGILTYDSPTYTTKLSNIKYVRNRLPTVRVNGDREIRALDARSGSGIKRDRNLVTDENIRTVWATNVGVQVTRNSYALANQNHDNYIILEYTFLNNGSIDDDEATPELGEQDLKGVYFGFVYEAIPSHDRGHRLIQIRDEWAHYYGNQPGDTLRGFWDVYDGNAGAKAWDDTGDPDEFTGEFLALQHVGFGVLHADAAHDNELDAPNQPATVTYVTRPNLKTHETHSDDNLYDELSSHEQSQGTDTGEYLSPTDPVIQAPVVMMAFGPYDIPFGQDVKIVMYEAIGSISRALAIQAGHEWKDGSLNFAGFSGDQAKNALLASGHDSLHVIASRAEWAWRQGLSNVPDPPPAPSINIDSGPGKVLVSWQAMDDQLDPDTGQPDFGGYRVYRAVGSFLKEYELVWDSGDTENPTATTFEDFNVERGNNYFYLVTTYDDGSQNTRGLFPGQKLESSRYYNRNYEFAGTSFLGARNDLDSVYVVPNPYHADGYVFGGDFGKQRYLDAREIRDQIAFVGLPAKATIRVFTAHGDLVATIHHPDPQNPQSIPNSADEAWFQFSDSYQIIKSGIYFFHVEGWDRQGNPLGSTTGKFVIIR